MKKIAPMLAGIGTKKDLKHPGYLYEPKLDGIRALCYADAKVRLINRNAKDITYRYPDLDFRAHIRAKSAILDGEIIAYDKNGNPNFSLMQQRDAVDSLALIEQRSKKIVATYVAFDILMKNGKSLINLPLTERKKILNATIKSGTKRLEKIVATKDGVALWKLMIKHHLEGVIAKDPHAHYIPGKRPKAWLKIKFVKTIDCIIIGYTQEKRKISALALAVYFKGKLRYVGKVGTGFSEQVQDDLHRTFSHIRREKSACVTPLKNAVWVKPIIVAEIEYLEKTKLGILRAPVFLRSRTDKKAKECTSNQ